MDRDNPQEIGNVVGLDWLAGITDGEGCIALMVFRGGKRNEISGKFRLQMRATIANTNAEIIDRTVAILASLGVGHHIQVQKCKSKRRETGRTVRLVHVTTKPNLLKFLSILHPRLADTDKKERARILLQLIRQRDATAARLGIRATHCYTQADVDLIIEFLRLTRSKQTERLAEILNDCTRKARNTVTKKSRARHDTVWSRGRSQEGGRNDRPTKGVPPVGSNNIAIL